MKNKLHALLFANTFATLAALSVSTAQADESDKFTIAAGFDYTSGKYGKADTTDILSIPLIGMYQNEAWTVKLTIPYVSLTGTGDVVVGGRQGKATTSTTRRTTQSGFGDVQAAATYGIYAGWDNTFAADVSGRIKFGTASTKLGTGENDYAIQTGLYKGFGKFTSMTTLGYEVLGSADGTDSSNATYAILGGDFKFTNRTNGGAEMKISERYSPTIAGQRELTIYANHRMDDDLNIRGYVLKGFSDGSADSGFGLMISSGF